MTLTDRIPEQVFLLSRVYLHPVLIQWRPDQNRNLWIGSINLMSPHLDTKIERPVITPIAYEDHIYVDPVVSDVVQKETFTTIDIITSKCKWKDGRQIVELDTVAIYLKSLQKMRQPLHQLSDCVGETRFGLAQSLQVQCRDEVCRLLNDVPTGKKQETNKGGKAWDINTKLATGKRKTSVYEHF